jgi:hypothetical protein
VVGFIAKQKDDDKFYLNRNKELGEHIIIDGILSKVVSKKGKVYKVINHNQKEQSYIVTDGNKFAHGNTIKEAKESLIYKLSDRDTSKYKSWTLDKIITKEEAIESYMAITGACATGTKYFVDSLKEVKARYTVGEVIELTKGQYNNEAYKNFFGL